MTKEDLFLEPSSLRLTFAIVNFYNLGTLHALKCQCDFLNKIGEAKISPHALHMPILSALSWPPTQIFIPLPMEYIFHDSWHSMT